MQIAAQASGNHAESMVFWARPGVPGPATASCQRVTVADPIFIDNERSNDMATLLQALRTHGPKLVYNRMATTAELAEWLSGRTGLTRGQVLLGLAKNRPSGRGHPAVGNRGSGPSAERRPSPTHSRRSDPDPHCHHAISVSAQADTWPKATQRRIHSLGAQRLHPVNAYDD
jgi:hypothetical protein